MHEHNTEFHTAAGRKKLWIAEVNETTETIRIKRSTGGMTSSITFQKLKEIHDRIQEGELILDQYVIDEAVPTWGNYITGLLRYLGCFRQR
jgi:hypothetical protein